MNLSMFHWKAFTTVGIILCSPVLKVIAFENDEEGLVLPKKLMPSSLSANTNAKNININHVHNIDLHPAESISQAPRNERCKCSFIPDAPRYRGCKSGEYCAIPLRGGVTTGGLCPGVGKQEIGTCFPRGENGVENQKPSNGMKYCGCNGKSYEIDAKQAWKVRVNIRTTVKINEKCPRRKTGSQQDNKAGKSVKPGQRVNARKSIKTTKDTTMVDMKADKVCEFIRV